MSANVRVAIAGALGRMGQAVQAAVEDRPGMEVVARFDRSSGDGLVSRDEALSACDVLIDFTTAESSVEIAKACAGQGRALVTGATGMSPPQIEEIARVAERIPVVRTGNFSLGVNVLLGLVRQAAQLLPARDWDIEIIEAHHNRKVDAPSGTGLMLGEAAAAGRGVELDKVSDRVRDGITGPRRQGNIGFSVIRAGGIVGEHSVIFGAEDEIVTFHHSARDRSLFAKGAVTAAQWIVRQEPGLYDMQDVLGFADVR